jgi:hypothetical protein
MHYLDKSQVMITYSYLYLTHVILHFPGNSPNQNNTPYGISAKMRIIDYLNVLQTYFEINH